MESQIRKVETFKAFVQIAGRVTIPEAIRVANNIQPGDLVEVELKIIKRATGGN